MDDADKIVRAVDNHFIEEGGVRLKCSVSIGGGSFKREFDDKAMMRVVDNALYRAKAEGKSQVVFAECSL